jgi:type I restriction enzyme S subunit
MGRSAVNKPLPSDLPALPSSWRYVPLHELVTERGISYGIVQPGQDAAGGVPIVRVNNIKQGRVAQDEVLHVAPEIEAQYGRTRLRGGEVLLTLVGSIGECAIADQGLVLLRHFGGSRA